MRRAWLLALLIFADCRRKHEPIAVDEPPPPSTPVVDASLVPVAPEPVRFEAPRDMSARRAIADAGTINGDPEGPREAAMSAVQAQAPRLLDECLARSGDPIAGEITVKLRYSVGNDGRPRDVTVEGPPTAETLACLRTSIVALTFPSFKGPLVISNVTLVHRAQPRG